MRFYLTFGIFSQINTGCVLPNEERENAMQRMEIQAPAKINLFLDILGKRPDGYHNIKSIVLPVSVYDRVVLENCPDGIETVASSDIQLPGIPWTMTLCRSED